MRAARSLEELVRDSVTGASGAVEKLMFGTVDTSAISAEFERLALGACGAAIDSTLFYAVSVGCVAGLRLDSGQRVVVKALPARYPRAYLAGVHRVQGHLASRGFPCPRPIAGPLEAGNGYALVDAFLSDPGVRAPGAESARVSAAGLARLVNECVGLDPSGLSPHPLDCAPGALYPEPHSPIFDFTAAAGDAAWIDDIAEEARARRDATASEPVIAHTDWSARNVRIDGDEIVAVYDWDSVSSCPETIVVGQAAATWSAVEGDVVAPSAVEMAGYVRAYESERGRVFAPGEHDSIGAAAAWVLAYTSRCEHAIDPQGLQHQRARPRLRSDAPALLDFARVMDGTVQQ